MKVIAKILEALGIASVMIGLVQGIQSESMWVELYLSIIGIAIFLIGWSIEKILTRKEKRTNSSRQTAR